MTIFFKRKTTWNLSVKDSKVAQWQGRSFFQGMGIKTMTSGGKYIRGCTVGQNRKKHRINAHPIIHCPTSEEVSEVSERANLWVQRSARAKQVVWSKRTSERCERCKWCERTIEWTSERPSTPICILGWSGPQCTFGFLSSSLKTGLREKDVTRRQRQKGRR